MLNPLNLAIAKKSTQCVKYIIDNYGLRQSTYRGNDDTKIVYPGLGTLTFSGLLFPLILQSKDIDIFKYILASNPYFDSNDLQSFILLTTSQDHQWLNGLKTFLWSGNAQFTFSALDS